MPEIVFETADGHLVSVQAKSGESAMRAAVANNVRGIDATCGGVCSCATCLVEVSEEWSERVGPPSETEADMIEFESEPTPYSRLACQIVMGDHLDGLRLKVVRD